MPPGLIVSIVSMLTQWCCVMVEKRLKASGSVLASDVNEVDIISAGGQQFTAGQLWVYKPGPR